MVSKIEIDGLSDCNCVVCGVLFDIEDLYFVIRIAGEDFNMCSYCKDYSRDSRSAAAFAMRDNIKLRLGNRGRSFLLRHKDKISSAVAKLGGKGKKKDYSDDWV